MSNHIANHYQCWRANSGFLDLCCDRSQGGGDNPLFRGGSVLDSGGRLIGRTTTGDQIGGVPGEALYPHVENECPRETRQ